MDVTLTDTSISVQRELEGNEHELHTFQISKSGVSQSDPVFHQIENSIPFLMVLERSYLSAGDIVSVFLRVMYSFA